MLHTWGQKLTPHPHIHCVVPGGGLASDGQTWVASTHRYFLSVQELSRRFREALLKSLDKAFLKNLLQFHGANKHLEHPDAFDLLLHACRETDWVVYAKPPFGGPEKVLDYLARYTHRVAISNHRLLKLEDGKVSFTWRDYKHEGVQKEISIDAQESIRRFLLHVFPSGFTQIRYYGLLTNRYRTETIQRCHVLLNVMESAQPTEPEHRDWPGLLLLLTGKDPLECPKCHRGRLTSVGILSPCGNRLPSHAGSPP